MELFNGEDVNSYIKKKLNSGWCIIDGDLSITSVVENVVGSKNFGFVMFGLTAVAICKKTDALKKMFAYPRNDFNSVVMMTFVHNDDRGVFVKYTGCGVENKSDFVDTIIAEIKQFI